MTNKGWKALKRKRRRTCRDGASRIWKLHSKRRPAGKLTWSYPPRDHLDYLRRDNIQRSSSKNTERAKTVTTLRVEKCAFRPRGGGGSRYILGWGGAARPLIPWACLRQKSLIFLPCLRHLSRNHNLRETINNIETHIHWQSQNYLQLFKTKIDKIDSLIKTKNDKIDTLFKTKIPKNIPWLAARPH